MLRLTAITPPRIGTVFHPDGSPAFAAEYTQWYLAKHDHAAEVAPCCAG